MPTDYTTTFGKWVNSLYLPTYADYENDPLQIILSDDVNSFLSLYPVPYGEERYNKHGGFSGQDYEVRSEKLVKGQNAEVGNSTVTVTWEDMNSGQTVTANFTL